MKKIVLLILVLLIFFVSCENPTSDNPTSDDDPIVDDPIDNNPSTSVQLKEIRFQKTNEISAVQTVISRNILGTGLDIQEALEEPLDGKDLTGMETTTYGFTQFQFIADIFLRSDASDDKDNSYFSLLRWGGDPDDLTKYIDLVAGRVVDDGETVELPKVRFDSIVLQVNAPGDTIIPDFAGDYSETSYSWGELKPFFSTNSSAQTILLSTYVDTPVVKWVEGDTPEAFATSQTVLDYNNKHPDNPLEDLGGWVYNSQIPLNQEFFDILENTLYSADPHSGEAWLILPLNEALDFTQYSSSVTINFDFFLADMMEVHSLSDESKVFMLSGSKEYTDTDGNKYYSPFPVKITAQEE